MTRPNPPPRACCPAGRPSPHSSSSSSPSLASACGETPGSQTKHTRVNKPPSNQPNARPKKTHTRTRRQHRKETHPAAPPPTPLPALPDPQAKSSSTSPGPSPPPGVLTLPASSRVTDAITAAGGALEDADLDTINLARPLTDGEHIRISRIGETPPAPTANGDATHAACVRLDTATVTDLQTLPGIGPALADRIIDYRATHPHITSVDALDDVPGIGPSLIEKIRPGVCP